MKRKIFITLILSFFLGLFISFGYRASAAGNTIYASPNGSNTNSGTSDSPLTLAGAIGKAQAGDTVILKAGIYDQPVRITIYTSGTYTSYINMHPENEDDRVVLDFSKMDFNGSNRGIQLNANYWYIKNIEITGAGDNGLYISGSNNIIEDCQFYRNSDSGLQLGRDASSNTNINTWPSNNLIKNCTSFYNYDKETLGENADGFAAKLTVGQGNVFDGCIAFRNSDDGWDLYAKEDSGNIGTVTLLNCFSFENGFLPEEDTLPNGNKSYNTTNGDGIGFKLGGGVMEGDVVVENCIAFNNKLHGFSDNSNPGFIRLKNCTAINNCIGLNEDGTVAERGIVGEENKSNNFDLARDTTSYNSYFGLLSYINNQKNFSAAGNSSYNEDAYRGSVAYSIFQTSYDTDAKKELYVAAEGYQDASSHGGDALPNLTKSYTGLSDSSFASIASVNAIGDKIHDIHKLFRNEDMSINIGNVCKVVDPQLLTYANGEAIGANLSKGSYADYKHFTYTNPSDIKSDTDAILKNAYDALDVLTNSDAVLQNFEVAVFLNKCEISWESSNTDVINLDPAEKISKSNSVYITAKVYSPANTTKVTLTATITYGSASLQKTFELTVLNRSSSLGKVLSSDGKDSYIVERYHTFLEPTFIVQDGNSYDGSELSPAAYTLTTKYEYAENKNDTFYEVNGIYTSVPGVFRVTKIATLKSDTTKTSSFTYFVYIGKDETDVDFVGGFHTFRLNSVGFNISGSLSSITGKIYAVVVSSDTQIFSAEDVVNHPSVQVYSFSSDYINFDFEAPFDSNGYRVYYVISDKVNKHYSELRTKEIKSETISTKDEFYNLAQGIKASNSLTVYNLTTDLDFTNYEWKDAAKPGSFVGAFNGNGHTISNLTIVSDIQKQANIFYKLENGTVVNVNFKNIDITNTNGSAKLVGIVGAMNGGYISNVRMENISSRGTSASSGSVGALVGQMIGGINYVDHVSLINDENQEIYCGNKYVAAIVGNIQMDSGVTELQAYISYCLVRADIGNGKDSGGCVSGIVGRIKNDNTNYYMDVNNCYYKGTVTVNGNYNGGIVGSIESGQGLYNISDNFADVVFVYTKEGNTVLDARNIDIESDYQAYAHKNCNPICGRANTMGTDYLGRNNYGSWEEYYSSIIKSTSIYFSQGTDFVPDDSYFRYLVGWDMDNVWAIDANGNVTLR